MIRVQKPHNANKTIGDNLMGFFGSKLLHLVKRLIRSQVMPEVRMKVVNITRQTVLASCADVADRGPMRRKGLLGRESLSLGEGLWILPCEAVHTFGMHFPIDLVYLDRKYRIRKVRSNVPSGRLSACFTAHSVLELPAGAILGTRTRPGDFLEFSPAAPQD